MKISIATSLLLSVPVVAFTPKFIRSSFSLQTPRSTTTLGYVDSSNVQDDAVAEEDPVILALATHLEITEKALSREYKAWSIKYGKIPSDACYATFKKNFLMQEAWNRENGQSYALDEYGDSSDLNFHLDSIPTFESNVFANAKTPSTTTNGLDENCDIATGDPFLDWDSPSSSGFDLDYDEPLVQIVDEHFFIKPPRVAQTGIVEEPYATQRSGNGNGVVGEPTVEILKGTISLEALPVVDAVIMNKP